MQMLIAHQINFMEYVYLNTIVRCKIAFNFFYFVKDKDLWEKRKKKKRETKK